MGIAIVTRAKTGNVETYKDGKLVSIVDSSGIKISSGSGSSGGGSSSNMVEGVIYGADGNPKSYMSNGSQIVIGSKSDTGLAQSKANISISKNPVRPNGPYRTDFDNTGQGPTRNRLVGLDFLNKQNIIRQYKSAFEDRRVGRRNVEELIIKSNKNPVIVKSNGFKIFGSNVKRGYVSIEDKTSKALRLDKLQVFLEKKVDVRREKAIGMLVRSGQFVKAEELKRQRGRLTAGLEVTKDITSRPLRNIGEVVLTAGVIKSLKFVPVKFSKGLEIGGLSVYGGVTGYQGYKEFKSSGSIDRTLAFAIKDLAVLGLAFKLEKVVTSKNIVSGYKNIQSISNIKKIGKKGYIVGSGSVEEINANKLFVKKQKLRAEQLKYKKLESLSKELKVVIEAKKVFNIRDIKFDGELRNLLGYKSGKKGIIPSKKLEIKGLRLDKLNSLVASKKSGSVFSLRGKKLRVVEFKRVGEVFSGGQIQKVIQVQKSVQRVKPLSKIVGPKQVQKSVQRIVLLPKSIQRQVQKSVQKQKLVQKQVQKSVQRIVLLPKSVQRQVQRKVLIQIQGLKQIQKLKQGQRQRQGQRQGQSQGQVQSQRKVLIPKLVQIQVQSQRKVLIPKFKQIKFLPKMLPKRKLSKLRKMVAKILVRVPKRYRPNLEAVVFNIVASKKARFITGVEVRPIIRRMVADKKRRFRKV